MKAWLAAGVVLLGGGCGGDDAGVSRRFYVSGYDPTISVLNLVSGTGAVEPVTSVVGGMAPSWLAFGVGGKVVYALDEVEVSTIGAFAIGGDGGLTAINRAPTGGKGAAHVAVDPSGQWLLSANYVSGDVAVNAILGDGGVGAATDLKSGCQGAHQIVFAGGGKDVFVPCLQSNFIMQFTFAAGKLTANDPATVAWDGGPRHLVFDRAEKHAYLLTELDNNVTRFDFDAAHGTISNPASVSALAAGGVPGEAAEIAVHGSGKFLYASNRADDSIAIFALDAEGKPTNIGWQRSDVAGVRHFTFDPSGTFLLAASQTTARLAVFRIDQSSGQLTLTGPPLALPPGPAFVGFSPQ